MVVQQYRGNCHCGKVRFEIKVSPITTAEPCDCNVCRRTDHIWAHVPSGDFEPKTDYAQYLTSYDAGSGPHEFCKFCGSGVFRKHGTDATGATITVNVRTLHGVNPFRLDVNGATRANNLPQADLRDTHSAADRPKRYAGSCACGKVKVEVKSPPLPTVEVKEDNCSICVRTGLIGIYPDQSDVVITGREHTTDYVFWRRFNGHPFCTTCGVLVFLNLYGPPREVIDRLPEARRQAIEKMLLIQPVNVRSLDDVEWSLLNINRTDGGTEGYELAD